MVAPFGSAEETARRSHAWTRSQESYGVERGIRSVFFGCPQAGRVR
jgi:hypothetical protein